MRRITEQSIEIGHDFSDLIVNFIILTYIWVCTQIISSTKRYETAAFFHLKINKCTMSLLEDGLLYIS